MGITVEKRKLAGGRVALYLNFSFGHKRWRESLHLTLEDPVDTATRKLNREKMKMALAVRSRRELELITERSGIRTTKGNAHTDLRDVCTAFIAQYRRKDIKMVQAAFAQLVRFTANRPLYTWRIDRTFCLKFYDYLREHHSGHTPTGYFNKFKQCLDFAVEQHYMEVNPAAHIRLVQQNEFTKAVLTQDEIRRLATVPCLHAEVKRAFLFACMTGLRWCDVVALRTESVDEAGRMLHLVQQKVEGHSSKAVLHLALNDSALALLRARRPATDGRLFVLPSYSYAGRVLKRWMRSAGIDKHITFHCARHSFVTNLLLNGANIKTASELAGHSTIRHTEKYIHIADELKRKAVDSLPTLELDPEWE